MKLFVSSCGDGFCFEFEITVIGLNDLEIISGLWVVGGFLFVCVCLSTEKHLTCGKFLVVAGGYAYKLQCNLVVRGFVFTFVGYLPFKN